MSDMTETCEARKVNGDMCRRPLDDDGNCWWARDHAESDVDFPVASKKSAHIELKSVIVKRCSSCGSTAEHHVDYIERHGLCIT